MCAYEGKDADPAHLSATAEARKGKAKIKCMSYLWDIRFTSGWFTDKRAVSGKNSDYSSGENYVWFLHNGCNNLKVY